jgi:hypothetical protein
MQSQSSVPAYSRVRRIFSRFGGKKFPVMPLREFTRNPLATAPIFYVGTAPETLNRQDSRLFSRFTGIGAGIVETVHHLFLRARLFG